MSKEDECLAVNEDGLVCKKKLYHAQNGEWWDHAGGHMFASDKTWKTLTEDHVDATALLSGLPASSHSPEDCTYDGFCAWRKPLVIV